MKLLVHHAFHIHSQKILFLLKLDLLLQRHEHRLLELKEGALESQEVLFSVESGTTVLMKGVHMCKIHFFKLYKAIGYP
jgi:hypothetical protein